MYKKSAILTDEQVIALSLQAADIIAPVFQQQGWEWVPIHGVPDHGQIAATVQHLIDGVTCDPHVIREHGPLETGTGRIWVTCDYDQDGMTYGVHVRLDLGARYICTLTGKVA